MGQLLQQSKVHQALNGAWQIQDHCMDIQIHTSLYIQLILHTAQPITYVTFQQIHVELTAPIRAPHTLAIPRLHLVTINCPDRFVSTWNAGLTLILTLMVFKTMMF